MSVEYLVEVCLTCCQSYRLPFVFITMYGVVCVQLAHLRIGDWKDISIAHVIIIIKTEVSTFHIVIIFIVFIFCHLLYVYSGKTGNLYITPSHYHHCANFIWRHWTYKMPVRYNLSGVWVRLSIFSQLSIIQYVGLCVFSLPISFMMIGRIYILCLIIIIKSEIWTITHCLGLGHETMVCAVCLSIFLRFMFNPSMDK